MRWKENQDLANKVKGIDIIFSGHDHFIRYGKFKDTHIVVSGTNFETFSFTTL